MRNYASNDILSFFQKMNQQNIEYLLLMNIANELPYNLPIRKDIDILIHPDCYKFYQEWMMKNDFKKIAHPHGLETGWIFLYGMNPNIKFEHMKNRMQIDACDKLATKSIGMLAWVPLDQEIQTSIWRDKIWNPNLCCWQLDERNLFVYLVVRSVFEKNVFLSSYVTEIKKRKEYLNDPGVEKKLTHIFFCFTPILLNLLRQEEYDAIFNSYITFDDY